MKLTIVDALTLSNTGLRVALAKMVLESRDEAVTVEGIMRVTGLGKSTVYRGRSELNDRFPDPGTAPEPVDNPVDSVDKEPSVTLSADQQNDIDVTPVSHISTDLLLLQGQEHTSHYVRGAQEVSEAGPPVIPLWRQAVMAKMTALASDGAPQSWNLAADVYLPAYSQIQAALGGDINDCIALAVDYVETIDDEKISAEDRALVAKLIRKFGKVGLWSLDVAIGVTNEDDGRDRFRYARQVAAGKLEELRSVRAARQAAESRETAT